MNKQRMEAEQLVYRVMDKLDPSEKNKEFWMGEFSKMSDDQFKSYISKPLKYSPPISEILSSFNFFN